MAERGDVVSVPAAADESVVEALGSEDRIEGSLCGEDAGEVMVEVVGSDVFVDGVGNGGACRREEGDRELGEEETADGEGNEISDLPLEEVGALEGQALEARIETRVEGSEQIAGSLGEQAGIVAEEAASMEVNEGSLERGEQLVGGGDDVGAVSIRSSPGSSLDLSGSICERTEVAVETVVVTAGPESLKRELVLEGSEKDMNSAVGEDGTLDGLQSDKGHVLHKEIRNSKIGDAAICSSTVTQSQRAETIVAGKEVATTVGDHVLDGKDEGPGGGTEEGNLASLENDHISTAEASCAASEKDGAIHANSECLNQPVLSASCKEVQMMDKDDSLRPKGNLKAETAGKTAGSEGNLNLIGGPTENVTLGEVGGAVVAGSPVDEAQVAPDSLIANDRGAPISGTLVLACDGQESLKSGNKVHGASDEDLANVEDEDSKVKTLGGAFKGDVSVCPDEQQTELANGSEVSVTDAKTLCPEAKNVTKVDIDTSMASSEGDQVFNPDQDIQTEVTGGIAGKAGHLVADLESSNEKAVVSKTAEMSAMDVEVLNVESEVAEVDAVSGSCPGKDQHLQVEKVDVSCEDDIIQKDLESSVKQTQIADGSDIVVTGKEVFKLEAVAELKDGKEGSNSKIDVLLSDSILQKAEDPTAGIGIIEKDGTAQVSAKASGEQIEIDTQVESSASDFKDFDLIPDENKPPSEKAEVLKCQNFDKISVGDPSQCVDSRPNEDHRKCLPSPGENTVSNDNSVLNGRQTIGTCVSDPITYEEVVNPEAKGESYKSNEYIPDTQVLSESMVGSLVVDLDTCLDKDGKWKSQDESTKEYTSLSDESHFVSNDVQAMGDNVGLELSECFEGGGSDDLCLNNSNTGKEIQEQRSDVGHVSPCGEQETELGEQTDGNEHGKHVEDKSLKQTTLKSGSFVKMQQPSNLLPPVSEGDFSVTDLVWGKVRSHPWWPGQVFDPADASEKAMKHHKKDCFLVAYFGDRTFTWHEASLLKPFLTNFSQIEKQSNSEAYLNAVRCALEEVSRRFELGLACSCIPKDAYDKIESQIVENAGIRQESSRRYGVDRFAGVSSFEPNRLVQYLKALAQYPSTGADQLELVIAKAQLLAFSRLKGYSQLPEFQFCGGLLEDNSECSQLGEVIDSLPSDGNKYSKENLKTGGSSSHKRKHNLRDSVYPSKKEKSLSELMGDMASSPDGEDGNNSVSPSFGKKRKAVDFTSDGSDLQDRRISIHAAKVSSSVPSVPKPSFKVGECIRRVASQLTGSPSILKFSNERIQKVDGSSDMSLGSEASLQAPDNSPGGFSFPLDSSLDDMVSQLQLAARDPRREHSFMTSMITFFCAFRNSISLDQGSGRQNSPAGKVGGGRKRKASHAISGSPEEFEFDDVNDSYWTDRIIQNASEEQLSSASQKREGIYQLVTFDPAKSPKASRRSYPRKRFSNGNPDMATDERTEYIDESKQDNSPAELILNFTVGASIPSEVNLNKIFKRFGPLKESETEVDLEASRARVIFKRGSDAKVAFSSARTFNILGPLIVNYQLNYSPSLTFKTLALTISQGQDDATDWIEMLQDDTVATCFAE